MSATVAGVLVVSLGTAAAQPKTSPAEKMVGGGPAEFFWAVPANVVVNSDVLRESYRGHVPPLWAYKSAQWFGQNVFQGEDGGLYVKNDLSAPHLAGAARAGGVCKMMGWSRVPYPEGTFGRTDWDMFRPGGLAGWPQDAAAQYRCDHPRQLSAGSRSRQPR